MIRAKAAICQRLMRSTSIVHHSKRIADAWLMVSVHFDAFRAEPRAYLVATKWWIKRKRVRARGQFAPLLSQSPQAYRLWTLRQERTGRGHSQPNVGCPIIALIDLNGGLDQKALALTQQSLTAEGLTPLAIGSLETPTLAAAIARIDWRANPWLMLARPGDRIAPGAADA